MRSAGKQEAAAGPLRRLRVLVSAYACEPGRGSEPGVGWNLVRELVKRHHLTVITRANNRSTIEASAEEWVERVDWVYHDPPRWATFWKRGGRGVQVFYILWQFGVGRLAKRLVEEGSFDVAHHITFGRYWIPSGLAALGVPFLFGPVGGGERTPDGFVSHMHWRARIAELAKSAVQRTVARLPACRRLFHAAAWTFAATNQTEQSLRQLGVTRISILPQSGIDQEFVDEHAGLRRSGMNGGTVRLVTACRLIHWKAVDLAIEALARIVGEVDAHLDVLQDGPEQKRLRKLAKDLGVGDRVHFLGRLPALEDVYAKIGGSDALVHPALHEAFGQACLESLALGVPVICLDWGGPGLIVDETSGYKVVPTDREETIARLSEAMRHLATEGRRLGAEACRSRAVGEFSWSGIAAEIDTHYRRLCAVPVESMAVVR